MIVNLEKFIAEERSSWEKLDDILARQARDPWRAMSVDEARELERLYQRASADLARLSTFSAEPETRRFLESLVARGYAEIYGAQAEAQRFRPWRWFTQSLPQAFRRNLGAFFLATALLLGGAIFGGAALYFDPAAKEVLMPFEHLQEHPADRVAREEERQGRHLSGNKAQFSGMLMTHNTRVTLTAMALGMTWGVGTLVVMFFNGVGLGAVAVDYISAGQTTFLLGWLLPHGSVEIPAILVGGQAGFVLAGALLGRRSSLPLSSRLRKAAPDVVTLCFGAGLLLVWAGFVEAFLSQYHEPVVPYQAKIALGLLETVGLWWFLFRSGLKREHGHD